jgi:hypothetical protein
VDLRLDSKEQSDLRYLLVIASQAVGDGIAKEGGNALMASNAVDLLVSARSLIKRLMAASDEAQNEGTRM